MIHHNFRLVSGWLTLLLAGPLFGQFSDAAAIQYTFQELHLGMVPVAMNNRGWMAGYGFPHEGSHAVPMRYRPGVGTERLSDRDGQLYDINDAGTAVGYLIGSRQHEAMMRPAGGPWQSLGWHEPSIAYSINEAGNIVGVLATAERTRKPFLYTPATGIRELTSKNGSAFSVNESGQILGKYEGRRGTFVWDPANGFHTIEIDGAIALDFDAFGIADNGTVGGSYKNHFATYSLATGVRLAGPRASANAINDRGWMVGADYSGTAFLYVYGQSVMDLNTLTPGVPARLTGAIDINDRDEILAWSGNLFAAPRYFLLRRVR